MNAHRQSTLRTQLLGVLLTVGSLATAACGGAALKVHNGYPDGEAEPWKKAISIKFNDAWEADADGRVSFPDRRRAMWYVVDLPSDGSMTAKLSVDPQTKNADVGFEVLDAGFNAVAPQTDEDEQQPKKTRQVADARTGKVYFHVWAVNRTDVVEYSLKLAYSPIKPGLDPRSTFPYTIPNPPALAMVPAEDDSPVKGKPVVHHGPSKPVEKPVEKPHEEPMAAGSVRGSINEFGASGGGVHIVINKGNTAGIEAGWTGYVIDHNTHRAFPNGSFTVKVVKNDECEAIVNMSLDDVQGNKSVVLKPPK